MNARSRRESATGDLTIRVRDLVQHAYSRPPGDRTPGVALWGGEVYEDGVRLGRVHEVRECTGEYEVIYYEDAG